MRPNITYSHEKVSFNVARIKTQGDNFEVAVDPDLAIAYKKHGKVNRDNLIELLRSEKIFFDVRKGELASEERVKAVFGTDDFYQVAEKILSDGEIQLTAEYREQLREKKRNKLIDLIRRTYVDPKNKIPHPRVRIENAMEEVKFRIEELKSAEEQMIDAVKKLRTVLPLSTEERTLQIYIPSNYAAKMYGILKQYGTIEKENWNDDGSLVIINTLSANLYGELMDKLNADTHGSIEIKIIK